MSIKTEVIDGEVKQKEEYPVLKIDPSANFIVEFTSPGCGIVRVQGNGVWPKDYKDIHWDEGEFWHFTGKIITSNK